MFNRVGTVWRRGRVVQFKCWTPVYHTCEEIGRFTSCSLSRQLTRVEPCCTPTYRERAGRNTAAWERTVAAEGLKDHWCVRLSSPGCKPPSRGPGLHTRTARSKMDGARGGNQREARSRQHVRKPCAIAIIDRLYCSTRERGPMGWQLVNMSPVGRYAPLLPTYPERGATRTRASGCSHDFLGKRQPPQQWRHSTLEMNHKVICAVPTL